MKLLIDTNIVIDVLQKREPWFSYSYRILERCISGIDEGFLSAHSLSDIFLSCENLILWKLEKQRLFFSALIFRFFQKTKMRIYQLRKIRFLKTLKMVYKYMMRRMKN